MDAAVREYRYVDTNSLGLHYTRVWLSVLMLKPSQASTPRCSSIGRCDLLCNTIWISPAAAASSVVVSSCIRCQSSML